MKTCCTLVVLIATLFTTRSLFAQDNWVAYSKSVSIKAYAGKKIRMTAYVKVAGEESDAKTWLWAHVIKSDGKVGFSEYNQKNHIHTSDWKLHTIEGLIDQNATSIIFGAFVQLNGKFFFDDFEITVETTKNKWKTIYKATFEDSASEFIQGFQVGENGKNTKYHATTTSDIYKNGKYSLVITGQGVPNFGSNNSVGKFAGVNGIKLYYEIYGSGHPLLVLHGNGGSIASASPHYPQLMKKYKVIAIDSRAQGKSTDTDAPLTYDQMAADVNALLNELKVDSAFIWGQSDGAILGLLLAKDYPKKVKRVLAYGTNIQPDTSAVFSWVVSSVEKSASNASDSKEKKLNQLMLDYPHIPYNDLKKITAPVLIMSGDRDAIRLEHTVKIYQHLPKGQLCILPGSTHGGSWEKQELFLQLLDTFFLKPFSMPDTKDWFH
jgi:pimeloyl-ACP methyl ester carboxylesterase